LPIIRSLSTAATASVVAVLLVALLPPRYYGKPEAAVAVDRLLMMGKRMPETC
jgi:hypothetical protein